MEFILAFIVAVLTLLVALLLGWNIYAACSVEKRTRQRIIKAVREFRADTWKTTTLLTARHYYDLSASYFNAGRYDLCVRFCVNAIDAYSTIAGGAHSDKVDILLGFMETSIKTAPAGIRADREEKSDWIRVLSGVKNTESLIVAIAGL